MSLDALSLSQETVEEKELWQMGMQAYETTSKPPNGSKLVRKYFRCPMIDLVNSLKKRKQYLAQIRNV